MAASPSRRALIALPWLLRVRWWSISGQVLIITIALLGLRLEVPVRLIAPLIAAVATSNLWATWYSRIRPSAHIGGWLLLLDVVALTAMLAVTGGPLNPFSMLYLVYITLAATALGGAWTWTVTLTAAAGFAALFVVPVNEHSALSHAVSDPLSGHLQGMWWAFATAALLTAFFVVRLANDIDERDRQLEAARERAARSERLASLTTLAAGAAHELGSPLSTIAVAAGELERDIVGGSPSGGALDDVRLIRQELARARAIVDRMAIHAGDPSGEMPHATRISTLLTSALDQVAPADRGRVSSAAESDLLVSVPPVSFARALADLIRNGLDAHGSVSVSVQPTDTSGLVSILVHDTGDGMPPDIMSRVGEPFFTTKAPGRGMGLGVFLCRHLVESLGGTLTLASEPGKGTFVTIRLPYTEARK